MAKRGLGTILKKNKLKAYEIFCIVLDDYLETLTTEESILSIADIKKLQNSLIETTEERQAYNKLVPLPDLSLFGELSLVMAAMEQCFVSAETRLKTLYLMLNDKRIKKGFIEILTEYQPTIITETELEEEKRRRIERNLEKYSTLDDMLFDRMRWYLYTEKGKKRLKSIKSYTRKELKKIDEYDLFALDKITDIGNDFPEILSHALHDIKEKILERKIVLINRQSKESYNDFNRVDIDAESFIIGLKMDDNEVHTLIPSMFRLIEISNRELYHSGLPEHKERMEDVFNEKGYWPDSWIQDIAIYKPLKGYGETKDYNIDERGFYKKDISMYVSMLELTFGDIFERQGRPDTTEAFYTTVLCEINEYMQQAYAYYNAIVIFSEKTKMPKLKEYADGAKESVEFTGSLLPRFHTEELEYMKEYNMSRLDPFIDGKPAIFKPAFTPESKIKKARALSGNTPLTKYSIREIAEILESKDLDS